MAEEDTTGVAEYTTAVVGVVTTAVAEEIVVEDVDVEEKYRTSRYPNTLS